jgi:hypothetical protein
MGACLRNVRDTGSDRVEIDVGAGGQERFFVENGDAFEPTLEERSGTMPLKSQLAELSPIG